MVDTTSNVSHQDQLLICLEYVDSLGKVCERSIAVCALDKNNYSKYLN